MNTLSDLRAQPRSCSVHSAFSVLPVFVAVVLSLASIPTRPARGQQSGDDDEAKQARNAAQVAALADCDPMGCPGASFPEVEGEESPEAVFSALQSVARAGDSYRLVSLLPPSTRCQYLYASLDLVTKGWSVPRGLEQLGEKYGYSDLIRVVLTLSPKSDRSPQEVIEDFRADVEAKGCSPLLAQLLHVMAKGYHDDEELNGYLLGNLPTVADIELESTDNEDRVLIHAAGQTLRVLREEGRWYGLPELFGF